jgi:hypothetical protein
MDGPPAAVEERSLRDSFGTFENVVTSEHFAVKWGDALTPDEEDVTLLLEALELSWTVEMEELGYPAPSGTDEWFMNVYVANSGSGAPEIDFDGGRTLEADGFAYIFLAPSIVALFSGDDPYGLGLQVPIPDPHAAATEIVAHELFHAIQYAADAFGNSDDAGAQYWLWESTASWAGHVVSPSGMVAPFQAASYWVTPYLPLSTYADPGSPGPARGYGAWCFWFYVEEVLGERTLVRDLWTSSSLEDDALDLTKAGLAARGHEWSELFLDFALKNAVYDYPWGDFTAADISGYPLLWGGRRIAATWDDAGSGGLQLVDDEWGLHRASYNVIEVWDPDAQTWDVTVESDDDSLVATIAITEADGYRTIPLLGRAATFETTESDRSIFLVIAQPSLEGSDETVIEYSYSIDPVSDVETPGPADPTGPGDSPEEQGCGCGTSQRSGSLTLLILSLCAARRRSPCS